MGLNVAFNLLFGMAFLASSFVVFVVQERTNGAKHVQLVSGVDPFSYWTASWMWDLINFTFPCICIIILFACFDVPAYTGMETILDIPISSKLLSYRDPVRNPPPFHPKYVEKISQFISEFITEILI